MLGWPVGRLSLERDCRPICWVYLLLSAVVCLSQRAGGTLATDESTTEEDDWSTLVAVTAVRGSTAKLPCDINSQSEESVLLVLWYKNASVTPVYSYDSRGRSASKGVSGGRQQQKWGDEAVWGVGAQRAFFDTSTSPANLLVKNVTGQDEGNYRCKVHFRDTPSWSQRITLNIKDPPGFPRIQDSTGTRLEGPIGPYEDGATVKMMCLSSGEPPPGLVWGGEGQVLGGGSAVEREGNTARTWLNVVASRSTSGVTITCSTTNTSFSSGLMNTVSVTLRVNLPPLSVVLEPPGEYVSSGQQTTFRCKVVGSSPEPVVQWWLGGRQLAAHPPLTTIAGNLTDSSVSLTPEPGDHGVLLVCRAFCPNLPGTVLHDQLTLIIHFVPVATISLDGVSGSAVREGGSVGFTCHYKANPPVYSVSWFHNGRPLRRLEWRAEASNTSLKLRNVTASMRGLYTCVASNKEGDGQSNAVNLNVEFSPICDQNQRKEYVAPRGGSVTVACSVLAYPTSITFTWALVRNPESPPVQLHTVGRVEGLTGRYNLTRLEEDSVELWCLAKNAIGKQRSPCRFAIYTQGRPGPVNNCNVGNHTASGFLVKCKTGPLRSMNTVYTLIVFTQKQDTSKAGGGGAAGGSNSGSEQQKEQTAADRPANKLGDVVKNITTSSPSFTVTGLQPGQEFALVVRVSNEEGVSPSVVLSAFTLKDNAQTVIGKPTVSEVGATNNESGGSKSRNTAGGTSPSGSSGVISSNDDGLGAGGGFWMPVPPMILVLVASLAGIILMALIIILVLRRRGTRPRLDREMEQVKLSEEMAFTHTRTPESTSRETPGSSRKDLEGSDGRNSSAGDGGTSGGDGVGGGGEGGEGEGTSGGVVILGGPHGVGGSVVGVVSSVADSSFGSCNGDLLTTTSRDSLLGTRSKQGDVLESFRGGGTTLPILGVQNLGEDPGCHVVLEGLRPLGATLTTPCSTFRPGITVGGLGNVGGVSSVGGITTMGGVSTMGGLNTMRGISTMSGINNMGVVNTIGGVNTVGGVTTMGVSTLGGVNTMGSVSNLGGINTVGGVGTVGVVSTMGNVGTMGGVNTIGVSTMGGVSPMSGTSIVGSVGSVSGGLPSIAGVRGIGDTPATPPSQLLQVTLIPENAGKDRCRTPSPRGTESVSAL